jgi:hypothetical protein
VSGSSNRSVFGSPGSWPRRSLGAAVVALATLPLYRVLEHPDTGVAGAATVDIVAVFAAFGWFGTLLVAAAAVAAARALPVGTGERLLSRGARLLERPRAVPFAVTAALLAAVLTAAFSLLVLDGKPNFIDALAQMLHARFLAEGRLAGPADAFNSFWHIQNSVVTERGWVSQYPPGHVFLIAAAMRAGVTWALGPVLMGFTVFATALIAERVWPQRRAIARLAALLTASSTFLVSTGASYLNHVPTAALLAFATYCVLRARRDGLVWAVLAGAAVGAAFTMRPLTALSIGFGVGASAWWDARAGARRGALRMVRLGAAAAAGAALPVALILLYNRYFFGHATTFGYNVALGPRMGLGFGRDPWGNVYGPLEAIGYTSSDLTTLGVALLETPLSAVLVVGLMLCLVPRLSRGERVLAAWALAPVAANALYWHHGIYMGPRMLYEAAPAWVLLFVGSLARLYAFVPRRLPRLTMYSPRMAVAGAGAFALLFGLLYLAPQRAVSYGGDWFAIMRVEPPRLAEPSLVFVHDAWSARLGMTLAARGMRLDSVETLIRQNPTCRVQDVVETQQQAGDWRAVLNTLDFQPRATDLPATAWVSAGNKMRLSPDGRLSDSCAREIFADRFGILDIAPLTWQGDLPGGPARGPLYVRDLGPERNAQLIAALPERVPVVLMTPRDDADPVLRPYDEAMRLLWHGRPAVAASNAPAARGGS